MTSDSARSASFTTRMQKAPMIVTAFTALVLSFGLLFGVQYLGQSQNLQRQAAEGQRVLLRMNGSTIGNNVFRVDFYMNSQGYNVVGTQVTGKISGVNTGDVSIDLGNSLNLQSVGSKLTQLSDGTQFTFTQFAPLDASRKVNTNGKEVPFASITVRRNQGTTFTVTLDSSKTSIPVSGNAQLALDVMQSRSFTISQYQAARSTPTPTPGSNVGDGGIHRSCNQYCADKNECAAGLSCYYNKCRNPLNVTSESCSGAATPQPTPKATPAVVYVPAATPRPATPRPTPTASVSATPRVSPLATASATPIATGSGSFYDENSLKVSPSPTIKRPSPSPTTAQANTGSNNGRLLTAGLIILVALGIVIPVGIYLYRRVR